MKIKVGQMRLEGRAMIGGAQATSHLATASSGSIEPQKVGVSHGLFVIQGRATLPNTGSVSGSVAAIGGNAEYDGKWTGDPLVVLPVSGSMEPAMPNASREGATASTTAAADGTVGLTVGVGAVEGGVQFDVERVTTWFVETMNAIGAYFAPVIHDPAETTPAK